MAIDLSKIDIESIDPERLDIGTGLQDCSLIANTFERGAHSIPTESAVFAPLSRTLANTRIFSSTTSETLKTYLKQPEEAAATSVKQAQDLAAGVDIGTSGSSTQTDHTKQSLNIGDIQQSTFGDSFGDALLQFARDCIPCGLRLVAFLEIHPNIDLLGALEADLKARLSLLSDLAGLLNNFNIYGDFCELLNLLSFMCIPDLQRIIATLMALFILDIPKIDGLIGMLQALIAPIFTPILMAITSLLDQFSLLVTSPLECVIDAINEQLRKLNRELDPGSPLEALEGGLAELNQMVTEAKQTVQDKLAFYIEQVEAMLGEFGTGDIAYLNATFKRLKILRLIGFVTAIISAITKGHSACSSTGKSPELSELDSFFNDFLSPSSPFNIWIDEDGNLNIDEEVPGFVEIVNSPTQPNTANQPNPEGEPGGALPSIGNVFQFEGEDLLDPTLATTVEQVGAALTTATRTVVPCKLETTVQDAEKVNAWIRELNQS